jgi:hypothetical protein
MPDPKKPAGGETGYANNKVQWFFEDVQMPRVTGSEIHELADEMYEEMYKRGWSPDSVDWKVVEQGLSRFLAAQAKYIVEALRKSLDLKGE